VRAPVRACDNRVEVLQDLGTGGRDVVLFTIEGGGHTWPGGPPVGRSVGRVTRDLDATRVMLDFFDHHPQ